MASARTTKPKATKAAPVQPNVADNEPSPTAHAPTMAFDDPPWAIDREVVKSGLQSQRALEAMQFSSEGGISVGPAAVSVAGTEVIIQFSGDERCVLVVAGPIEAAHIAGAILGAARIAHLRESALVNDEVPR